MGDTRPFVNVADRIDLEISCDIGGEKRENMRKVGEESRRLVGVNPSFRGRKRGNSFSSFYLLRVSILLTVSRS